MTFRKFCSLGLMMFLSTSPAHAQSENATGGMEQSNSPELSQQVIELRALVQKLQARVDDLERRTQAQSDTTAAAPPPAQPANAAPQQQAQAQATPSQPSLPVPSSGPDFLHGTTFNLLMDGYYGYNFNNPIGRVNLLRAYDVSSNAFSLNQAALVVENAPDPDNGDRKSVV